MAEAIIRLLDDDRLAERLVNNGVKYAQEYDWNKMVEDYVKLFHQVCTEQ
jgi:glycosyltransferase involved in cell wall biosynthesis